MKEKRKGPIGRAAGLAEGFAATVRRMQREREPRLLVYDEAGYARLVQPDGRGYERLLDIADRMVALVDEAEADARPLRRLRAEAEGEGEGEGEPKPRRRARRDAEAEEEEPKPRRRARRDAAGDA